MEHGKGVGLGQGQHKSQNPELSRFKEVVVCVAAHHSLHGAMSAVWLASYPDGALRKTFGEQRNIVRLPVDPWFRELLTHHCGPGSDQSFLAQLGGGVAGNCGAREEIKVRALLRCSDQGCKYSDGPLTAAVIPAMGLPWFPEGCI